MAAGSDHHRKQQAAEAAGNPFYGGGEAGAILGSIDWSQKSLGPVTAWPQSLRTAISICLASRHPICIIWGPERHYFYNDAYTPIVGAKHPWALGESYVKVWPEIWESSIRPILELVESTGEASWCDNLLLVLQRHGFAEECYFAFSFAPMRIEDGSVGGVFTAITERTTQVIDERRLRILRDLSALASEAKSAEEACRIAGKVLAENPLDVPFAAFYLVDASGNSARLVEQGGLQESGAAVPTAVSLIDDGSEDVWSFRLAVKSGKPVSRGMLESVVGRISAGPWPEPVHTAAVVPILRATDIRPYGFVVCGASPRLAYDESYQSFFKLIGSHVTTAVANADAHATERRRAESLLELARAKTDFFSNISHEFRTPLTLILGPLDALLQQGENDQRLDPEVRQQLEITRRNSLRLLKLVNTLLDFSRIESGKMEARYETVDLPALTAELASLFRSAIEAAGIRFIIDCPPAPEPAWVDSAMWEKIVFNLLSNACKFTLNGEIEVRLRFISDAFELSVRDTGLGIAPEHHAKIFERFHRIDTERSRTHEGSGIGLSLVRELARFHGGSVAFESVVNIGSRFIVRVPSGRVHVGDKAAAAPRIAKSDREADAFVRESLPPWPRAPQFTATGTASAASPIPRVLVVDDNADMREYVKRILKDRYDLVSVADGEAGLALVHEWQPDLVVADVMMPRLDGFGLIKALRADVRTRTIPVILLSARAGEESYVDGLEAGADDYLVKPFSALELRARVQSHLQLTRLRRDAEAQVSASEARMEQLVSILPAGIIACDAEGRITFYNRRAAEICGGEPPRMENYLNFAKNFTVLGEDGEPLSPEMRPLSLALKLGRRFQNLELTVVRRDGSRFIASCTITPTLAATGEVNGAITIFQDVTAEVKARSILRETEQRFRLAADNAPVLIWIADTDRRCTWFNQPWLEFVGRTLEQEVGVGWADNLHPDDYQRCLATYMTAFDERRAFSMEFRLRHHDGQYRWMLVRGQPRAQGVDFAGFIGSCVDITDRRKAEVAMQESRNAERARREELEVLTQVAPAGIWMTHDAQCTEVTGNAAAYAMMRTRPGTNLARPELDASDSKKISFFRNGQPLPIDEMPMRLAARTGRAVANEEIEFRFGDGSSTWAYGSATPLVDERGNVRGVICVMVDITDRKRAGVALRKSEEQLRLVTDHASVLLAQVDREHRYRFANRTYAERSGRTPHEMVGLHVSTVIGAEAYGYARNHMDRALAGMQVEFESERLDASRAAWWGHVVYVPERTPDGKVGGFVAVISDITQRKRAELELERARDEALAASRAKDDFLAALSHELRTPLSPVLLLASEGASNPQLPPAVRGDFETIRKSVELEARLIDDLLDLTRIVRDKLVLEDREVDVVAVLRDALKTVGGEFEAKRIGVSLELPDALQIVRGDAVRLQQVFWNILKNAAKFTFDGGRVTVTARRSDDGAEVFIEISDTGIGITAQELERVFDAFSQGDHATPSGSHRFGGLGLGLAISRRVVQLHHGQIAAESAGRHRGALFRVVLPLVQKPDSFETAATLNADAPPESGSTFAAAHPAPGTRILLVEDHVSTRVALEQLLIRRNYLVRTAGSVGEALLQAQQFTFDYLVSDIGLPDGNGYDLMKELHAKYGLCGISLTGYGMEEDVARSRSAGFVQHLTKPVRIQSLDQALTALAARQDR